MGIITAARRFLKCEHGGPSAEFGLIVFPMVVLFIISIQFGVVLFVHNDMHNAARDAARQLASNSLMTYAPTTCDPSVVYAGGAAEDVACRNLDLWSGVVTFTVTPEAVPIPNELCDYVQVTITASMADASIFNLFGIFDRQLVAFAKMRSQWGVDEGISSCILDL